MNTKLISQSAQDILEQYRNFRIGQAICSVPYFNNKATSLKGALKAEVGKGSPKEIFDEVKNILLKNHIDESSLTSESLKKLLVENNLGIDCSGFAYYLLNEESLDRKKGTIDKHIHFVKSKNLFSKFRAKLIPEKNVDVFTFSHDKNSHVIPIKDAVPGDIITMQGDRAHILVVHQIEYQNSLPITLHYIHSVAWPTDGEYGHGIHEGKIEIIDLNKPLVEQRWTELNQGGEQNYTLARAIKSVTELRRLNWF